MELQVVNLRTKINLQEKVEGDKTNKGLGLEAKHLSVMPILLLAPLHMEHLSLEDHHLALDIVHQTQLALDTIRQNKQGGKIQEQEETINRVEEIDKIHLLLWIMV